MLDKKKNIVRQKKNIVLVYLDYVQGTAAAVERANEITNS